MPGGDGGQAAALLRDALPSCRVLMLTTVGRTGYLRRAVESGAVGFLSEVGAKNRFEAARIAREKGWL